TPTWEYAAVPGDAPQFATGSRAARIAILRALRNAGPARARDLLAAAWRELAAEERAALLDTLAINLALDDEPFLEAALDDRAREVRRAAAELLARLAGSRLVTRMIDRVRPRLARAAGVEKALGVTLPEQCAAAMARDGV